MLVYIKRKECEDVEVVCTVKQLFSLWADLLVMEYFKNTKSRELPHCTYCAAKVHFARVTKSVCHIPEQEHMTFWNSLWSAQNLRPPDIEIEQPNLDGTCSLQIAGHTIFHETSQEIKSRHFPWTQWWLSHGKKCTATEKFGLHCQWMKTVVFGVFLCAFTLCLWLVPLFWTCFCGHLYLDTKRFCKPNI